MFERIRRIVFKEFVHVLRDKRLRLVLVTPPLVQLIVLGYAIDLDVNRAAIAVLDRDRTPASRALVSAVTATGKIRVTHSVSGPAEGTDLLDSGAVNAYVEIPRGFSRDLARGSETAVQVLVDGSDASFAALLGERVTGSVAHFASRGGGPSWSTPVVSIEERGWFNTNFISRNYFIPGIIALILMIITLMLTAMAVVRERELGTLEQILVSPVSPLEMLLGKTIPFAIIAYVEVAAITVLALFVFGIPFRGSVLLLFGSTALYLLSTLGAGLLISTISRTQQQAMMTTFLFLLPAILLSGFAFPITNMPRVVQWITYLDPLRYFLVILRGIFLKGVGVSILWPQMAGLLGVGLVAFGLGVAGFRRTLE